MCTLVSRRVPVSVYSTVHEPIHQNTPVIYNGRLGSTAMKLRRQQTGQKTVTISCSSDVRRLSSGQVQFVSCGCFLRAFSWVGWRRLRWRRIWYLSGWKGKSYLIDRMTLRVLPLHKVKCSVTYSITRAVYPISFICPVIFIFKYQAVYRSRSLSGTAANCT